MHFLSNKPLGALEESDKAVGPALNIARRTQDKPSEKGMLAWQAWIAHLDGDLQRAAFIFDQAEKLENEITSEKYLYNLYGIQHADHLRRILFSKYARDITDTNLQICKRNHWLDATSKSHRVLGDLDSDAGDHPAARAHYEDALKLARLIQRRDVLIEALLARGGWQARHMKDSNAAFSDLNEAIGYCVESGYRIYEADIRVALAWAYLANDDKEMARGSAERALQMSEEMGYHWGKVDAEKVLKAVSL
jgi:tetratricopeptide (TPR) repeat protein